MNLVACQKTSDNESLPTLARFPTETSTPIATNISVIPSDRATATITVIASPTITNTAIAITRTLNPFYAEPSATNTVTLEPLMTATPLPAVFVFGQSANGNELKAYRYGTGSKIIMLIGGIHAGYEVNSVELMEEVQQYLDNNPAQIQSEITFLIIPSLNPDGLEKGRTLDGRFNGNGIDLNRNWGCDWSGEAFFQERTVDAGEHTFSEPETIAMGGLIQRVQPVAVLFYHAAADGVYEGSCENHEDVSAELAAAYGEHSGYNYGKSFASYPLTGTASSWVASLGIPAVAVELRTSTATDFDRNLRAIIRLQDWAANQ